MLDGLSGRPANGHGAISLGMDLSGYTESIVMLYEYGPPTLMKILLPGVTDSSFRCTIPEFSQRR